MRKNLIGVFVFVFLACSLVSAPASAGRIEKAALLFQQAETQAAQKSWQKALELYQEAYITYPKAEYVFKIARCHEKLGNLPMALEAYLTFTQYEQSPGITKRVAGEVKRLEELLSKDHGKVFISSSPKAATVFVDSISKETMIRQTPATRWLKAGEHSLIYKKDNFLPQEIKIQVEKGSTISVFAGLVPKK